MLFRSTGFFLEYFGLRSLEELPAADELRRIVIKKPASLLTVDPGLATAPPEELAMDEPAPIPASEPSPEAATAEVVPAAHHPDAPPEPSSH